MSRVSLKQVKTLVPFKISLRTLIFVLYALFVVSYVSFNISHVKNLEPPPSDEKETQPKIQVRKKVIQKFQFKNKEQKKPLGIKVIPGLRLVPIEGKRRKMHIVDKEAEIAKYGKQELVYLNRTRVDPELESCLDPNGPKPVILMSLGRSGSTAIWQILGNLTGEESDCKEYTGATKELSYTFFEGLEGYEWISDFLCEEQRKYPNAGMIGFKWKPFETIESEPSKEALRHMAKLGIKVIRNKRNELDVLLSWRKNAAMFKALGTDTQAHCVLGAWRCLLTHYKFAKGIKLGTSSLLEQLSDLRERERKTDKLLAELNVPVAYVSYDKLFASEDATEWMRIFRFLGVGPVNGLTMEHVRASMILIPTNIRDHSETLKNFKAVEKKLRGTEFERLLRRDSIK